MKPALKDAVTPQELRDRLKDFAISVGQFARPLLNRPATSPSANQLMRAAAAAAANYRAACLARSRAEFRSRLSVALEEADESLYWLDYLRAAHEVGGTELLIKEGRELTAILTASRRTLSERQRPQ